MRLLALLLWLLLPLAAFAQGPVVRLDVPSSSVVADGDDLALSLSLSTATPYRLHLLDAPKRLVIDVQGLNLADTDLTGLPGAALLDGVRGGAFRRGWSRLVFDLRGPYAITEAVQRGDGARAMLMLRLTPVAAEDYAGATNAMSALWDLPQPTIPVVDENRLAPLRVAIDPGHGGADSGAVVAGLSEADLMLEFSRELTEKLIRGGFEVVLTRRKDVFVGLESRMTEARASNADILISLHADALPEGQATGATIFTWNPQADDRASRQLAARHDRADLVAGVDLHGTDDQIADTLMDMARSDTQPRSEGLAKQLSAQFSQAGLALHSRPVKGAAFSVLKSPDIPSVLLELGFLTDPGDRANLTDPAWRARMAGAITEAVTGWARDDAVRAALRRH
ncbi:N-acetylmuramoyl-L-alanine amidase [Paracoccus sp. SCSIO 75233]|uniref:N-acetylmuramoyl-L-alanine amidase n=1 Tax=Paracoccus sp. SCSIO 75233 TaxID=3017782 RepID=UPI0022F06248|nr:N-acetylmuramoyl-L-alanine amidase [Paracoccus sp. SCSIO 75233]WBU54391.1 N-acetylmuramoyl-L-alanine amidase [Paracoccus sp. SCSIO 75233]